MVEGRVERFGGKGLLRTGKHRTFEEEQGLQSEKEEGALTQKKQGLLSFKKAHLLKLLHFPYYNVNSLWLLRVNKNNICPPLKETCKETNGEQRKSF